MDACLRERLLEDVGPTRLRRLERLLAARDSGRVACEHRPKLGFVEAGGARDTQREQERAGLSAVRVVRGVDDLLRRHEPQQAEQVDRAPHRGVEEDAALARETVREVGEVGDARVGEDQLRAGVGVAQALERRRDRRQSPAGVDEDRDAALGCEREHRREPLVVEEELLGPWVELDPTRAEVEAPARLLDRPLVEREPHERDEATGRACRELERPVVAGAEAGVPVGLVEAEDEGSRDAVAVHGAEELLVVAHHPVDVRAEVRVGVEDVQVDGESRAQPLVPRCCDLPCPLECLHQAESSRPHAAHAYPCRFRADSAKDTVGAARRAVAREPSCRPGSEAP